MSLIQTGKEARHQVLEGRLCALPGDLDTSNTDTLPSQSAQIANQFEQAPQPHLRPLPSFLYIDDKDSSISCILAITRHTGEHPAAPIRDQFQADMDQQFSKLSPRAQKIADLPVMRLLRGVPNSAAAMTRFYAHADVDRECHSKHTAAKAHDLNFDVRGQLSKHEFQVLECAALLHDLGHRLGSHALDRVLAAHPTAPKIDSFGWDHEFHEFHTALLVAKDSELRATLGPLYADVLAVLTHCDNRPERGELASFSEHFGAFSPTLSRDRVALLAEIVEKVLDRNSCIELDFTRSGFAGGYIQQAKELVRKFEAALAIHDGELRVRVNTGQLPTGTPGWISLRDLEDYVACRQLYRETIAASPASCNVDSFLGEVVLSGLRREFGEDPSHPNSYEFLRSSFLQGKYDQLLTRDELQILRNAPHDKELLSVEDVIAPLATMTEDDFNDLSKFNPVSKAQAAYVCGVGRRDMSAFEFDLRVFMRKQGVEANLSVVITNDFEKVISYKIIQPDGALRNHLCFATRSASEVRKVVIAAQAIDQEGKPVHLGHVQQLVKKFCDQQPYLQSGCLNRYDRHVFARPFLPEHVIDGVRSATREDAEKAQESGEEEVRMSKLRAGIVSFRSAYDLFSPEIRQQMKDPKLKWELMGRHGLRESDVR